MTLTLRERQKQALREEIMNAAQELVAEKGYGAMSMDELAARVGISKPTLYTHFATKEELVVEAATREMKQIIALIESQADRSPMDQLCFIMRQILQRQVQMHTLGIGPWPEIFRLLCAHDEALGYIQRISGDIAALVQRGIAEGEIDPALDPEAVVRAFFGLASTLHKWYVAAPSPSDPQRAADSLVEIFMRGVRRRDR
ncbi:MAG: TetR/AcrR family transcriptional regulator [Roseiflexus sp.]|nr:TetR/AcrR family transcriptional regulator [Roseiflexus sp.]MBO9365075.1 TetR/AcrR family transcriptional regulator [Roseiflexus sp.]MBO9381334.1 TetR/AcrR family transcriptional regulator [Roseiflexus sp.]MBO9387346.1 TetR/AcrR family transcriptional regulator [Roseiflexus sp.]